MLRKIKLDIKLIVLFCIVLHPIIIGHLSSVCYAMLYGIPLAFLILNFRWVQKIFYKLSSEHFIVLIGIIVMMILSFITPITHQSMDFTYVNVNLSVLRKLLLFLFLFIFIIKKYPNDNHAELFTKYYIIAQCLYVCSTVVFLCLPPVREIWKEVLNEGAVTNKLYEAYGYSGRFGWSGFSGYRVTISCSLAIVFINHLYYDRKAISFQHYMIGSVMLVIGNMFYGRTGTIVSALVILTYLIAYHNIKLKYVILLFTGLSVVFVGLQIARQQVDYINEWYIWATKPLIQLLTGDISHSGTDSLSTVTGRMSFVPELKTLIWGDGYYTDPVYGYYYKQTDLGYMRQLLYWGLIGEVFTYSIVLLSILSINKKFYSYKLGLIIFMILFEYKGNMYFDVLPLFLLLGIIENNYNGNVRSKFGLLNKLRVLI